MANEKSIIVERTVIKELPKQSQLPRLAKIDERVNERNTTIVEINAVMMIAGSSSIACSRRGPKPTPVTIEK